MQTFGRQRLPVGVSAGAQLPGRPQAGIRRSRSWTTGVRAAASRSATKLPTQDAAQLPVPTGEWSANIPVLGETFEYLDDHMAWCHKRVSKHGRVFKTHLFGYSGYAVTDFDTIDMVYNGAHKYIKQFHPDSFKELLGQEGAMAMTYKQESHQKLRRQIGAALTGDALAAGLPKLEKIVRTKLEAWAAQDYIDLEKSIGDLALDFSNDLVVGLGLDADKKLAVRDQFKAFTSNLYSLKIDIPGTPFHNAKQAKKVIMAEIIDLVQRVRQRAIDGEFADRKSRTTTLQNYLAAQLQEGDELDVPALAHTCLALLVAGSDTSAWSLLVLMALLPQLPPHILQKIQEEQEQIIAKHGSAITRDALADMKYADAVVKEALRIKGPVDIGIKQTSQDIQIHGKRIPANSVLFMSVLYALAADPQVLKDEKLNGTGPSTLDIYNLEKSFVPERWLNPDTVPTSMGQFASGAHSCLGAPLFYQEAKMLLSIIAREYDMSLVKPGAVRWVPTSKIKPEEPIHMRFRPSKKSSAKFASICPDVQTKEPAVLTVQ